MVTMVPAALRCPQISSTLLNRVVAFVALRARSLSGTGVAGTGAIGRLLVCGARTMPPCRGVSVAAGPAASAAPAVAPPVVAVAEAPPAGFGEALPPGRGLGAPIHSGRSCGYWK